MSSVDEKSKTNKTSRASKSKISIKYDKKMNKVDEFVIRIFERTIIKILGILENKRP